MIPLHMGDCWLIGGGRDEALAELVHRPFAEALSGGRVACVVADEGDGIDEARWRAQLPGEVRVVALSEGRPLEPSDLDGCAGVYVAGGLTPLYASLLAGAATWLDRSLPYAGFSAGAAVAADMAIVGGWRVGGLEVCQEDAGEDLDELTVVGGLGRVPFAVDVHATQWGTLSRLVHAVQLGHVASGWAIDEHTALHVRDGEVLSVLGAGSAYRVTAAPGGAVLVEARTAG